MMVNSCAPNDFQAVKSAKKVIECKDEKSFLLFKLRELLNVIQKWGN